VCSHLSFVLIHSPFTDVSLLSLHDALPISGRLQHRLMSILAAHTIGFIGAGNMAEALIRGLVHGGHVPAAKIAASGPRRERLDRSEEHTSELQAHLNPVCRLPREKKKCSSW